MDKTDAFAAGAFILLVAVIVALAACVLTGNLNVFAAAAVAVVAVIIVAALIVYIFGGAYFMVKKKTVSGSERTGSSMGLTDVKEVDREMENGGTEKESDEKSEPGYKSN